MPVVFPIGHRYLGAVPVCDEDAPRYQQAIGQYRTWWRDIVGMRGILGNVFSAVYRQSLAQYQKAVRDEWAIMLAGKSRVSVLNPDGTIFLDDVAKGDLWCFPARYPHSIQGLGPNGCEFLLVFDEGLFSEDNAFLLSEWVAHTPASVLSKNFGP